jgi:hypothetical protein
MILLSIVLEDPSPLIPSRREGLRRLGDLRALFESKTMADESGVLSKGYLSR